MHVRDYRNAITFVQTLDGVDPERIGIWGTSYAGGHVLVVAAVDRRVRCVVAQVPTINGWQTTLRRIAPQALRGQRNAWDADRLERYKGSPPKMVPMVGRSRCGRRGLTRECGRVGLLHRQERAGGGQVAV